MGDHFLECDFNSVDSGVFQLFPEQTSLALPSIPVFVNQRTKNNSECSEEYRPDDSNTTFGLCHLGTPREYLHRQHSPRLLEDERLESYSEFLRNGTTYELDEYDLIQQKIRGQDPPTREIPAIPNERIKEYLWHKQCRQNGYQSAMTMARSYKKSKMVCVFCKNNKEPQNVYTGHTLKDSRGYTVCPVLRKYPCPICSAIGDHAHTIKYCPLNNDAAFKTSPSPLRTPRMSTGKRRY